MADTTLSLPRPQWVTSLRLVDGVQSTLVLQGGGSVTTVFSHGLTGPAGPAGPGSEIFQFTPSSPSHEWVLNHNFGRWPMVTVLSPGGFEVEAEVAHVSLNQSRVYFISPQLGTAIAR